MQDLEQLSYWQEKRLLSPHWYNICNPVISVELTELADRVVGNNDAVEEIQLDLTVHQHRVPTWNESLLMSMSDGLLRALQRWIKSHGYSMKTRCSLTSSSGTDSTPVNKMLRRVNKHSNLCVFPLDGVLITNIFSHARLVKL